MTTATSAQPVLINGEWQTANATGTFTATNPATGQPLPEAYPLSTWTDLDAALDAAHAAAKTLRNLPGSTVAAFLRAYADGIEANADAICQTAAEETGLPVEPRLKAVELPRTTGQLRQAADAAADGAWRMPTVDAQANLASVLEPVGPVVVIGPNNFPFAFNGISGGDFAAAIAAGNPVIAKAHPLHPGTSRLLAECALQAIQSTDVPAATVQMIYDLADRQDGLRWVADRRVGAVAFTGSRTAGQALKAAADAAGKPIYLEMSSVNPVVFLPGAIEERFEDVVAETATSGLMGAGQFCTSPGLLLMVKGDATERFLAAVSEKYAAAPCGTLLGEGVMKDLGAAVQSLLDAGAQRVTPDQSPDREGFAFANTLLRVDGGAFLARAEQLQTEAFGNAALFVIADDAEQIESILQTLEGNLTGCIYSATDGSDDAAYQGVAAALRPIVGRLLNDKMPTGVAVSPAMNHGGPFPATGHPHFTAVGMPGALRRFTMLACYDNVRPERLPDILKS